MRQHAKAYRLSQWPKEAQAVTAGMIQTLCACAEIQSACIILAYWPMAGEPDCTPLYADWHAAGKQVFLPRVELFLPPVMQFYRWHPEMTLVANRWGIREPESDALPFRWPQDDDAIGTSVVMLIPALAMDRRGYRVGYGAGFYDAYLSQALTNPLFKQRCVTFGVCVSNFVVPMLADTHAHDVALDGWVTEQAVHYVGR